ncbi:hypothetical protein RFM99_15760 [Mesorhizobium sp. VK4C]|uniref:hypothetical protein n=1 Tax=Mesorhizobium captivum TaxID=3072319 RepID=UPI002A23DD74|nr:hypothetical protein [Mesorhizobium sp. VK4C]MDX8499875.1 hypothetical protein [Mesorhizobium sp. VK4C]
MAGIPAHCDQCGWTFENRAFDIRNASGIQISNVAINCPKCGGTARVLDGVWHEQGGGIELVDGPQKTKAIFAAFRELVEQAERGELTSKQVQKKAAELDEGIGRAVGMLIQRYPKSAFFVVALVAMLKYMHFETKLDVNQLVQQVIEYTELHSPAEAASPSKTQEVQKEMPSSNAGPAENRSTEKHDRVLRQKPRSVERCQKNRRRRQELLERRRAFNPRRK